jgi:hypothetical protein
MLNRFDTYRALDEYSSSKHEPCVVRSISSLPWSLTRRDELLCGLGSLTQR